MRARILHALALVLTLVLTTGSATASEAAAGTSALDRIVERGEMVVGTAGDMPPMNMVTKDDELMGLDVDLARLLARSMGVKLKMLTMPFGELLPALEAGKLDMVISNMTITPKRNLNVAFVGPYMESGKAFLTKLETIAKAEDTVELNSPDITFSALKGSTSEAFVRDLMPKAKLVTAPSYDEAVQLVLDDKVQALVADFPICVVSVLRYPDQELISVITPITYEPLGIALPAGDAQFINWVQNAMGIMDGSGRLEALRVKWFKDGGWVDKLP